MPFIEDDGVPYCVLLENSDNESEDHARARFEALLETAFEAGCVSDAVVAENLTQAHQLWHVRESIPLAQAEEGLNIKHDISIPVSRIPAFVEQTDALLRTRAAGRAAGELRPPGRRQPALQRAGAGRCRQRRTSCATTRSASTRWSTTRSRQFDGSFSAEHGVGSLKVDKLEKHKSPVALEMMRAIKRGAGSAEPAESGAGDPG